MAQVKDIFISYGREDGVRAFVKSLKVGIEASGISVWLDVDDIPTGSDFHEEIGLALQSCRALVPVLTKKYTQSRYCKGELYVANGQQKILLPLVYEDGWDEGKEGAGVKLIVAAFNWAFFRPNVDDYQESLKKLVRGAKLKLNIPIGQLNVDAEGIMDALRGVKKWKELGHQLNINPEKLSILFNSGRSEEECRDEMISYWKKYDNDTSWEKLVRALLRIGENKLAEKIIEEQALSKSLTHKEELLSFGDNDNSTSVGISREALVAVTAVVCSNFFFVLGGVCGMLCLYFILKYKQANRNEENRVVTSNDPDSTNSHQMDLSENVAYGQI